MAASPDEDFLEIEITDYGEKGIEPERLPFILGSLHKIHDSAAEILGEKDARLRIAFVDSGSSFLLGLVSKSKVIEFAKRFFSEYWRQIWFSPYQEFNQKVESVKNGLGALQTIRENVKNGSLDEEGGRRLEHVLLSEMENLVKKGAAPKEVEGVKPTNRQQLLLDYRDVKLLEQPSADEEGETKNEGGS